MSRAISSEGQSAIGTALGVGARNEHAPQRSSGQAKGVQTTLATYWSRGTQVRPCSRLWNMFATLFREGEESIGAFTAKKRNMPHAPGAEERKNNVVLHARQLRRCVPTLRRNSPGLCVSPQSAIGPSASHTHGITPTEPLARVLLHRRPRAFHARSMLVKGFTPGTSRPVHPFFPHGSFSAETLLLLSTTKPAPTACRPNRDSSSMRRRPTAAR